MRIGIDARKIEDSGIGRYTENLIKNLINIDRYNEYVVYLPPDVIRKYDYPEERVTKVPESSGKYSITEHFSLAKKAEQSRLDIFHTPHYVLPYFLKTKSVVTIHDLIHLTDPSIGLFKKTYASAMVNSAVSKSEKIITVSEFSKKEIVRLTNVPSEKIIVTPNGGGADFKRPPDDELYPALQNFGIEHGYFLFIGSDRAHKNVMAVKKVMDIMGENARFVLAGRFLDETKKLFKSYGKRITFIGNVDKEKLEALYAGASALLFPSYMEGFGLPPLEAMACKTPVVASNTSSMPEVIGSAGILTNPDDAKAMAVALTRIKNDDAFRGDLIRKGIENCKKFSWKKMAEETLKVYESIVL